MVRTQPSIEKDNFCRSWRGPSATTASANASLSLFAGECTCASALEVAICSLLAAKTCGWCFDQLLHQGQLSLQRLCGAHPLLPHPPQGAQHKSLRICGQLPKPTATIVVSSFFLPRDIENCLLYWQQVLGDGRLPAKFFTCAAMSTHEKPCASRRITTLRWFWKSNPRGCMFSHTKTMAESVCVYSKPSGSRSQGIRDSTASDGDVSASQLGLHKFSSQRCLACADLYTSFWKKVATMWILAGGFWFVQVEGACVVPRARFWWF